MTVRPTSSLALTLAFAALLSACATAPATAPAPAAAVPPAKLQMIKYVADPDANQGNALAVDIVYTFSDSVVALLPLNGPDWFAKKPALMQSLGPGIEVISATIAPGTMGGINIPGNRRFLAAMAYTNHVDPGAHPFGPLGPHRCALIAVKEKSITYSECG